MVMEAPPSPQSVGREFVRQYYTLLNKAPMHLHRFYNHQSSFIHGGLDPPNRETSPVIGQKQIHQKIQQLNFRDCHAKITQVDSQATLGNGVVVQVTGELSNAGQPMRRFTQTFVLAAQSPKKYYVHNDIFRYQDEIISDEECEPDAHSEEEEELIMNNQQVIPPEVQLSLSQPPAIPPYYNPTAPTAIQPSIPPVPLHHNQQAPPHVLNAQPPVATVNGAIHPDDINVIAGPVPSHIPPAQTQQPGIVSPMPTQQGLVQPAFNKPPSPIEDPQPTQYQDEPVEEILDNNYTEHQDIVEPEQIISSEPASNEPKTYANLLKSSSNVIPYGNSPSSQSVLGGPIPSTQPRASSPTGGQNNQVFGSRLGNTTNNNLNNRGSNAGGGPGGARINQQQPARIPNRQDSIRSSVGGGGGRNSINEDSGSWDDKRRSQGQGFNDVNQLFLGNLPHTATEDELKEIFSEFGKIVDLRVHSKSVNKVGGPPGARAPPNYGFITYEKQEEVQTCLQMKPIFYPKGDKNGTILNVEEKKVKERSSFGGSRPLTESNRGGRGDNGGPRRGGPGGLGSGGPNRISSGGPGGANGPNNRNNSYNNRSSGPPNRGPNTYNRR